MILRILIPLASAAVLSAAGPLRAQPAPRALPTCVQEASAAAGVALTRLGCAGRGNHAAVRFSLAVPTNWYRSWSDSTELVLTLRDGERSIQVVGGDQLPPPHTHRDTLGFWMRAAGLMPGGVRVAQQVEDFRHVNSGRTDWARRWITEVQLRDSTLLAMAGELSAEHAGDTVLEHETAVRTLAGEPAGYLSELLRDGPARVRIVSYVTVRDGAVFLVTLEVPEGDHAELLPVWERVLASFNPRTERW
jgi:hypothetical protein